MIRSLPVTILIEGIVVLVYAGICKRPAGSLLLASLIANVVTQVILWIALAIAFQNYLATLLIMEVAIVLMEGVLLLRFLSGQLNLKTAFLLSACMNAASFGIGWLLPL